MLGLVDPFSIKSSILQLSQQQRLFEVLRLTSLFFGIGSIILVWDIAKRYLKINPIIVSLFFIFNPSWIMLSNYFKYDIALIFFILLTVWGFYFFANHPTLRFFWIAAIPLGLSLAVKISAMPLLLSYILVYYLFTPSKKQKILDIVYGGGFIAVAFFLFGIPDSIFHLKEYFEFFYLNIVSGPDQSSNYLLGMPVWVYVPLKLYPLLFGYGFYVLFLCSFILSLYLFLYKKEFVSKKREFLLFFTLIIFVISLIPLKILATGNRVLVIVPFMAILIGIFWKQLMGKSSVVLKRISLFVLLGVFLVQFIQLYAWLELKYGKNPREEASIWMKENLPSQTIGLENIPIYQHIPDVALLEFYTLQANPKEKTKFSYEIVDENIKQLPQTIILTNVVFDTSLLKNSSKNDLLARMKQEGYRETKRFDPSWRIYLLFAKPEDVTTTSLVPILPISVYQK